MVAALLASLPPLVEGADEALRPSLERDVLPLFKARCLKCHGPIKPKGKLNLSNARSLARGGSSGPVVVAGNLDESTLWELVSNDEMPPEPEEPLSADEKSLLRRWIEQGAKNLPRPGEVNRAAPSSDHWAFAPRHTYCRRWCSDQRRVRTSVDRFIQKALEDERLTLGPDADRATLIRRVSFDLTGLPPRPDDIAAFACDPDPDAYAEARRPPAGFARVMASAGASIGWMRRDTPIPTDTSAPIPTAPWPIATAIMSFARSTCRSAARPDRQRTTGG